MVQVDLQIQYLVVQFKHLQIESFQEFLKGFGSRSSAPPVRANLRFRHDFLHQHVNVDELKVSHFTVQHPSPDSHCGFTDDLNHISHLTNEKEYMLVEKHNANYQSAEFVSCHLRVFLP